MSQLSLVIFTVLAQAAVGMFIVLGMVEMFARPSEKSMTRGFIASLVILGIGAVASTTHLAQPLRMFNVMFGIAHGSALTLEIVALSLFGGAAAAYTGLRLFNLMPAVRKLILPIAMILGVVFILAIAQVYTLATVPTWNSGYTRFQFLMTAAVVGPVAAAVLLRFFANEMGSVQKSADKALATTGLITMTIALIGYVGYLFWMGSLPVATSPLAMIDYGQMLGLLRTGLLVAGTLLFAVSSLRGNNAFSVALISFAMILFAEFAGRAFFYDTMVSAGAGL